MVQARAKFLQGLALHRSGQLARAREVYQQLLDVHPRHFDALHMLGVIALQSNDLPRALDLIDRALAVQPDDADAHNNRGNALHALSRPDEALASYDRAITIAPRLVDAHRGRGNVLRSLRRLEEALASDAQVIAIEPDRASDHAVRGMTLQTLGRHLEALESFDRAIALEPRHAALHNNRGATLQALGRSEEAVASFDRALALTPDSVEALNNRGLALQELGRAEEALGCFDRAVALAPQRAEVHSNRGLALQALGRVGEALSCHDRAIALAPRYAAAHDNRGTALQALERDQEALASFDRALELHPERASAFYNRAGTLQWLGRLEEADGSYRQALRCDPDLDFLYGDWLHAKMKLCDWSDFEVQIATLARKLERGERSANPFALLTMVDAPELQRDTAAAWTRRMRPATAAPPLRSARKSDGRIRLGYYSADFHDHATTYLMAELFERHDRDRFEIVAYSFGPERKDAARARVIAAFDRFVDVRTTPDAGVARLSREMGIDIAIDLKGCTRLARPGIFAQRAAPIQVGYLGFPGTMGAPYIDYLIADRRLIPRGSERYYSEKIAYLPHSYQVNDRKRAIGDRVPSRDDLGLPRSGFVFCCFNNSYKIQPATFDSWMRILQRVDGSVLWLLQGDPAAAANLRSQAALRGIAPERLVFAKRVASAEHLARHRAADLFLDTFPCNAHTTASDALWAGLPLLTRPGEGFASRVATSLLCAVGLPELVAEDAPAYEALAVALATDPEKLLRLKQRLAANLATAPLFDTAAYTKHLEALYREMHARQQAGLPPTDLELEA